MARSRGKPTLGNLLRSLTVPCGSILVVWLGQSGFVLEFSGGELVVIDPYLSDSVEALLGWKRLVPKMVSPREIPTGLLLFTHEHLDHFDLEAIEELASSPSHVFAGAQPCLDLWREKGLPADRFTALPPGATLAFGRLTVEAAQAEHTPGSIGIVLHHEAGRAYHTGDSSASPTVTAAVRRLRPDILMLPINGRYDNMDPEAAAVFALASSARVAIPMHYGMFAENTACPGAFVQSCCRLGIAERVRLLEAGGAVLIPRKLCG